MSRQLTNEELLASNKKVFGSIERKLASNDEKTFIEAAAKITKFIEKREAYYPQARPFIGNILRTARSTLTRLTGSAVPFKFQSPCPDSLEPRIYAYSRLVLTASQHAVCFLVDIPLIDELTDIFVSAKVPEAEHQNFLDYFAVHREKWPTTLPEGVLEPTGKTQAKVKQVTAENAPQTSQKSVPPSLLIHDMNDQIPKISTASDRTFKRAARAKRGRERYKEEKEKQEKMLKDDLLLNFFLQQFTADTPPAMMPGQSKAPLTLDSTVQSPQVFSVQPPVPVQPPSASSISRAIPSSSVLANPLPPSAVKTPLSKVASPLTALRNTTPKLASPIPASPLIENPRGSIMVSDTAAAVTNTSRSSVSESAHTQAPPIPSLQVTTASVNAQSCASGFLASSSKPTTPTTPMAETASLTPPSAMSSSAKPASRPRKKPKLGKDKSLLVNSSLVQEDLTWFSTKQGKTSELSATSASTIVVKEEHKSPSLRLNPLPDVSASKNSTPVPGDVAKPSPVMEVPPPLSNTGEETRLTPIELDVGIETTISPMMANQGRVGRILKAAAISSRAPSNERKSRTSVAPPTPASSGAKAVSANFEEIVDTSTATPSSLSTKEPSPQMNPSTSDIDVVMDISSDSENQSPENLATAVIEHLDGKAPDIMDIDNSEAASASGCASVASPPKDKQETPTSRDASALAISASALPSSTMFYSKAIELQNAGSIIHKCSTKSVFGPSTAVYVSVNIGESTGSTVVMDFELTLNQERQLQLWKMREQHEQDVSNSTCLSLACYKQDDVVDVGFRLNVEDGVLVVESGPSGEKDKSNNSTLCELTPSWPTNSRLSAQIGTSRLFLAPPVQMTEEKFVDLTAFIEGKHIEIRLDHACDMTDYVFALIAHPPTSSQLHILDEQRAKCKKWRGCLDELRRPFTHAEVFG